MTPRRSGLLATAPLLLVLALAGCAASDGAPAGAAAGSATDSGGGADGPTDGTGAGGAAAGACLEGSTDCDDTPGATGTGGVGSGADGSVPVGEALAAGIQGPFLMSGLLVVDGSGARLCEALLESLPPQCGGASVPLEPAAVPAGAVTTTEGGVTWSEQPVLVEGEIVDGVFVVRTA